MSEETKKTEASVEKKEVEVPAKFQSLVAEIEKMSVLDLAELVKILEEKFGVSAAAPMMMAGAMPGAAAAEAVEEKSSFNVELTETGGNKISVIKVVREVTQKGLKEAKDVAELYTTVPLFVSGQTVRYKITGQTEAVQNVRLIYFDSTIPPYQH